MVHKLRQISSKLHVFDLYCFFSLVVSAALWLSFYFKDRTFLPNSFIESTLIVGSYFFFTTNYHHSKEYKALKNYPLFFLFQTLCFIGLTFKYQSLAGLYLGLIPCVSATLFFLYRDEHGISANERKGMFLFLIGGCSFLALGTFNDVQFISYVDGALFLIFSSWVMGLIYTSNEFVLAGQKSLVDFLLRRSKKTMPVSEQRKNRLFFHDLINHTHGLNLFLATKESSDGSLTKEDTLILYKEIKLIQSLVKDHFGYQHKNLVNTYDVVSFDFARIGLLNLVDNFLPSEHFECFFFFKGATASEAPLEIRSSAIVHYPSFYRVVNNIIKNIAEAGPSSVEFNFDYTDDGLHLTVKNTLSKLSEKRSSSLADDLGKIIMMDQVKNESGLGLESVNEILRSIGGHFAFKIENGQWVSQIYFPKPGQSEAKKAA